MTTDCLSVRDDRLFVEECDTVALAERFGTPLFVMSEAQLRSNARRFKHAFAEQWPVGPVDLLPAFKANFTLATRHVLNDEQCGADVYSPGELRGVLRAGVPRERISVNGGGKSEAFLRECIHAGVRITVEDIDEPEVIDRIAKELGVCAKIRFRVKPELPSLWRHTDFAPEHASIDLGIQIYKSGIPAEYLPELGRRTLSLRNVDLVGLHLHVGRHHGSLWYWRHVMTAYAELIARLSREWGPSFRLREIDIGGGFASRRDPMSKLGVRDDVMLSCASYPLEQALRLFGRRIRYAILSRLLSFFGKSAERREAPTIEEYARAAAGTLRAELERREVPIDGVRLQLEPGRGLYGSAGVHLTRVKKVKEQSKPIKLKWALTDTTCFFLANAINEMSLHDYRVANKATAPAVEIADVVGHSCAGDRILPFTKVPRLEVGDVIALLDTGAYEEASASNFNALPRPATILVRGRDAETIRRAETLDDVFARDVVPRRLLPTEVSNDELVEA
jgi:diaminopimelate decarboxylase